MIGKVLFKSSDIQIRKYKEYYYFVPKGTNLSVCGICGKKRKLQFHHIIPRRCIVKDNFLYNLTMKICFSCEKKLHPEYNGVWKDLKEKGIMNKRIENQRNNICGLENKIKKLEKFINEWNVYDKKVEILGVKEAGR